jgi:hypothetical protein
VTTFGDRQPGDRVNLEADVIAKYVERLLAGGPLALPGPPDTHRTGAVVSRFATIEQAIEVIREGGMVVVVDDEDRENEGDLVMAADAATPDNLAFIINHTSGVVCVPMLGEDLDRLEIPMMVARNQDPKGTAYTVSVDASRAPPRASRPPTGPARSRCSPTPTLTRTTSTAPATSSRCATTPAACCAASGTPRRRSTSPGSPAGGRPP